MFHITIIEELGTDREQDIERLSLRLDTMDLHTVVRILTEPPPKPRAPRVDRGVARGPRKQPNDPALL